LPLMRCARRDHCLSAPRDFVGKYEEGGVFTESAHKSFVGKIFSDKNQLRTKHLAKRGRWVYEGSGSEEKPT
jgi:hypothetical protein